MDQKVVQIPPKWQSKNRPAKGPQKSDICIAFSHRWTLKNHWKPKENIGFSCFSYFTFVPFGTSKNNQKGIQNGGQNHLKSIPKVVQNATPKKLWKSRENDLISASFSLPFPPLSLPFPPPAPPWTPLFRGSVPGPLQGPILGWFSLLKWT